MRTNPKSDFKKKLIFLLVIIFLLPSSYIAYKVYQYKTYIWLANYFFHSRQNDIDTLRNGHVMFLITDHHEPGYEEKGAKKSTAWNDAYIKNIEGIFDDYGNPVQYTWFYPYDHKNPEVILNLNELVYSGLGEIEFHLHHGNDTNETLSQKFKEALAWFNSYGCMISGEPDATPQFGFIHGNWSLDNSVGDNVCGVNRELDILQKYGCYADFTFSTFSTAQPKKINSIYYAEDTDEPKSYNTGLDAEVGSKRNGLMIFQGPICCNWNDRNWDSAALESTSPFNEHRMKLWLKFSPYVKGRPEWLFVKVYTHGMQSKDVILSKNFTEMLLSIKNICKKNDASLHFVTAREAYNIVKAAEDGKDGDPELYRDYRIKKPLNRLSLIKSSL